VIPSDCWDAMRYQAIAGLYTIPSDRWDAMRYSITATASLVLSSKASMKEVTEGSLVQRAIASMADASKIM
jgi:hypothetical protein